MKELLIVNPGSTSTKVAVYYGSERKFSETISHPAQELQPFANVLDQADYRAGVIARCHDRRAQRPGGRHRPHRRRHLFPGLPAAAALPASPIWAG